jgi:hypothetical protein
MSIRGLLPQPVLASRRLRPPPRPAVAGMGGVRIVSDHDSSVAKFNAFRTKSH